MTKYTGLEPHIPLRYHVPSVVEKMELIIPSINHTHKRLLGDTGNAKDLTGKEIVENATDCQIDWFRKQGPIS